jgi:hypothetical protein
LNFKGTPSQEEHITIFSGLRNDDTALSGWIVSSAFYLLLKIIGISSITEYDNPLLRLPHKMALRQYLLENWLSGVNRLRKATTTIQIVYSGFIVIYIKIFYGTRHIISDGATFSQRHHHSGAPELQETGVQKSV